MVNSYVVHCLSILFGIGAWITVNGVWVELPQLVLHLPEKWNLPSYLSVIVQLANIGPIVYAIVAHIGKPSNSKDKAAVIITTTIGASACLLLVFFWKYTLYVLDQHRSIALFVLVFLMALVDCTSSILFLPFMSEFREKFLISYMVGEGLSGLIPSILAIVQGVSGNPECRNVTTVENNSTKLEPFYPEPAFSTSIFFGLLFILDVTSLVAFLLLNYLPVAKKEKILSQMKNVYQVDHGEQSSDSGNGSVYTYMAQSVNNSDNGNVITCEDGSSSKKNSKFKATKRIIFLLILQMWLCALSNGVFTSVQSFSGLPYGNRAFHLCVTLSAIANPLASGAAFFFHTKKISTVSIHSVLGTIISCYLMATAVMSPVPPLVGTTAGEVLIVLSWILFATLFSYAKTCIAYILRQNGRRALFWCGVCTQLGSAIGSLIMFVLINVYNLFISFNPCQS